MPQKAKIRGVVKKEITADEIAFVIFQQAKTAVRERRAREAAERAKRASQKQGGTR